MRPPHARLRPYRLFFPLAALGGSAAALVVVLDRLGGGFGLGLGASLVHAHEMLHGHFLAAFLGVMLTALPRWTGAAPIRPPVLLLLAAGWCAARIAVPLTASIAVPLAPLGLALSAAVTAAAALGAAAVIFGHGDKRDRIVPLLLGVLAAADLALLAGILSPEAAMRLALSGALGVATLMAGRIAPALTRHLALSRGVTLDATAPAALERLVGLATAAALVGFVFAPGRVAAGLLVVAALVHVARIACWHGTTTLARPSIAAIHVGALFLPIGFLLAALGMVLDDARFADAALHAFGSGVLGLMCGAVQASVLRSHDGRALGIDRSSDLAAGLLLAATAVRLAAPFLAEPAQAAALAGLFWLAAQALLVVAVARGIAAGARDAADRGDVFAA